MKIKTLLFLLLPLILLLPACDEDCDDDDCDDKVDYVTTPYELKLPDRFTAPKIPEDNPMTVEGVALGRKLFYEPMLSKDNSQSCSSCHLQEFAFTDPKALSIGVDGKAGTRNSMPLFNVAYSNRLTWGGGQESLESQSGEPVPNPLEMHLPWDEAVSKLKDDPIYTDDFGKAFPGEEISKANATKAIAQFMRTIISGASAYDYYTTPGSGIFASDAELRGFDLFLTETGTAGEAECVHCHSGILFTDNLFHNNGLDELPSVNDFIDKGLGEITENSEDNGMFKTPSLRNIELTAPYMHDGRFETLREVIEHYSHGIKKSPNIDPLIGSEFTTGVNINMTDAQIDDLISFLKSLTDYELLSNEELSNPFE